MFSDKPAASRRPFIAQVPPLSAGKARFSGNTYERTAILERTTVSASAQSAPSRLKDDAAMLKAAASLTRDLNVPKSAIYWTDMLGSALLGYSGLIGATVVRPTSLAVGLGLIAVLALYRAGSFIHELTHIKRRSEGLPLCLELGRWCAIAGPELHVRRRAQSASCEALLRDVR